MPLLLELTILTLSFFLCFMGPYLCFKPEEDITPLLSPIVQGNLEATRSDFTNS